MAANRPLSPHMQIYRPQITSVLSILHRITGLLLCLGAVVLVSWVVAVSLGPDCHATFSAFIKSLPGRLLVLGLVFALLFHLCNGVRHLVWDMGYGFALDTTTITGWLVVVLTLLGTIYASLHIFGVMP